MKKILLIIISALILVSCSKVNVVDDIEINQIKSNYPVILKLREDGTACATMFPLAFNLSKKTLRKIRISDPSNFFHVGPLPTTKKLFLKDGNDLIYPSYEQKELRFKTQEWVVYVQYFNISKEQHMQQLFSHYLERAKAEHKDTLHIGNIQQLKQSAPELLNKFLQGDSIRLNFYYQYNDYYYNIILPVEIK